MVAADCAFEFLSRSYGLIFMYMYGYWNEGRSLRCERFDHNNGQRMSSVHAYILTANSSEYRTHVLSN